MRIVFKMMAALLLLFALLSPASASAAPFEFTPTAKAAFDKMTAAASKATAAKLTSQYAELQRAQKLSIEWDAKIDQLHYRNEEEALAARQRIREVDAAKLQRLQEELAQTKKKYEPLFALYDSLRQQLSLAKSMKDKWLAGVLSPQIDTAKAAVQLAKLDIRSKEAALKKAKADAAKTMKKLRDMLAGADPLKIKIKAAKSAAGHVKKQFQTEASILNRVVRKGDSTASLSSFARMLGYMKQINGERQKIYGYEQQIAGIIAKVNSQPGMK